MINTYLGPTLNTKGGVSELLSLHNYHADMYRFSATLHIMHCCIA